MRKILFMAMSLFVLIALAACNGDGDTLEIPTTQNENNTIIVVDEQQPGSPRNYTLEELGTTIVAAGEFWNDWWYKRGAFAWEHMYETPWYYWAEQPYHPRSRGYFVLLPSSGFETITDIVLHLQQFYTDIWINREMFGDRTETADFEFLFGEPSAFEEYDSVLYVAGVRWGAMRPDWNTATHTLISQNDNISVVETVVAAFDHRGSGDVMPTATFRIVFDNGRIENGLGHWEWPGSSDVHDHLFSPIGALEGAWTNRAGETVAFTMPNIGEIRRTPNGAYVLEILWDVGESRVWLFPVGVEMIRYNSHGERMYNESVVSDTSQVRLFTGDFEVTSCCTDEFINEQLFTRSMITSTEELKIQIEVATDELLSTFANLYHADVRVPGQGEGVTLVIWANQLLHHFNVAMLISDVPEDGDEWGFRPTDSFGSVRMLLPGEAFVIENYVGAGTLPHRGISFTDENGGNTRVFFFTENQAYPEHGNQWIIQEIEAERLIWVAPCGFDPPSEEGDYSIIINGVGFVDNAYGNADDVYTLAGEQNPTHVTMSVLWMLGLDVISGGAQHSLQYNGGSIGVSLLSVNYLTFGADRDAVGINDTFMADDFTTYIPISLLRHLGFDVHFEGGRVHIDGQLNVDINPHPLAIALQNFIDNAEGETRVSVPAVNGTLALLAIEFVDGFAEATVFVYTGFEVIYKEIGSIEGFPFSVGFTGDGWGNLLKVTGDGGNSSYTMFGVATNPATSRDEIVYLFTIYDELVDDGSRSYYRFDGGWPEGIEGGRHSITEEEFNTIRYGWGDFITCWRDSWDSTESILAWVTPIW
ncbi:MAG: hypothetical protein FWC91_03020 [Defluviitaleaceae bacterium]|nr:hypothetical protein [Defluviitaleaceae bacterium]